MSRRKNKLTQRERKTLKKRRAYARGLYDTGNTSVRKDRPYGLKAIQRALWRHPDTICLLCGTELSWSLVLGYYQPWDCPEARYHKLPSGKRVNRFQGDAGGVSR